MAGVLKKQNSWKTASVIFALAWPTMMEHLMQTAVQYIDTAMVGTLGTEATAAVGSTTTINWLIIGSISALGVGFLSFMAQAYGAGDYKRARKITAQAVLITLVTGILFTGLTLSLSQHIPVWMQVDKHIQHTAGQYFFILYAPMLPRTATIIFSTLLRATGDTKTPMRVGILVNIINVVLNFLLIYPTRPLNVLGVNVIMPGAGMGVVGAALASSLAFLIGGVCTTIALWRHPVISPRSQSIRPEWSLLKPCLRVALPNMLQRFGTSLGYVAFAAMINSLGEISTAAHTIANTVESAFYIPGYGMQTAAATLAGNALGAGDHDRLRSMASMSIRIEVVLMILSGSLLFFCAPFMMGLFTESREVVDLGTRVLRMVAVSEPFFGISIILEGMLLGLGKTRAPFVYNIIGMWGIRIVGTYICTQIFGMGLSSAWGCMIAHNLLLCTLFLIHYASGRWIPVSIKKQAVV